MVYTEGKLAGSVLASRVSEMEIPAAHGCAAGIGSDLMVAERASSELPIAQRRQECIGVYGRGCRLDLELVRLDHCVNCELQLLRIYDAQSFFPHVRRIREIKCQLEADLLNVHPHHRISL